MVKFWVYDVSFLILFSIFVICFLYKRRKNLSREGILYLYKTKVGIKAINYVGDKFKRTLHVLKYFVVGVGGILMGGMIYLLGQIVYTYLKFPQITEVIKAPPLVPVIPYFPKLFGVESFFPPFYFTYFILALAIVAICHEFAHGIYMKLFKIKIKSTGFAFLGPILGAFVEEDRKQFEKKSKLEQMSVLGAGTFANVVVFLIFFGLLVGFFFISFTPSGYIFNTYSLSVVPAGEINGIESYGNLTLVSAGEKIYFLDDLLKVQLEQNASNILAYDDTPAVRAGLKGVIVAGDDFKIQDRESLQKFLTGKKPGDKVVFTTEVDGELQEFEIVLAEHPVEAGKPYIGIGFSQAEQKGIVGKLVGSFWSFKEPSTYYREWFDGNFAIFVYNLLWWIMIINLLVALFNMMPLGILDGGRFFYLSVLSVTGSKKLASGLFKLMTYLILLMFVLLMLVWVFRVF